MDKPESRSQKILGAISQSVVMSSPVLQRAINLKDTLRKPDSPGETRLGNVLESLKIFAFRQTRLLQRMAGMYDLVRADKIAEAKTSEEKTEDTKKIPTNPLESVEGKENAYLVVFNEQKITLEKILDTLQTQLKYMVEMFKADKEASEMNKVQSDLDKVSRSSVPIPANENSSPYNNNIEPNGSPAKDDEESSGILDYIKGGAAAGLSAATVASASSRLRRGIGYVFNKGKSLIGATGSRLMSFGKNMGGRVSRAVAQGSKNILNKEAVRTAIQGVTQQGSILAKSSGMRNIVSKAPSLLSRISGVAAGAGRLALGTALGPAPLILTPTELGSDPQETFRSELFTKLQKKGVSALPEVKHMLIGSAGVFIRENFPSEEYSRLLDPIEGPKLAREIYNSPNNPFKTKSNDMFYGDSNPVMNRAIQNYTRDKEGFTLSPDAVRSKIISSPAAMMMQNNVKTVAETAQATTRPAEPSTNTPPVIVGKQGGVTNINNGGNVTNIITAGDSLKLPQMAFNLPSGVH